MAEFVADCPRCSATNSTHSVVGSIVRHADIGLMQGVEIACVCRTCKALSVHLVKRSGSSSQNSQFFGGIGAMNTLSAYPGSINDVAYFVRHITARDRAVEPPPEHLPPEINHVIAEANQCISIGCWNASAAMYRLALDLATKTLLPEGDVPNSKIRRSLGLRIEWLITNGKLARDLLELAECVKQDGNDGAHDGTLGQVEAEDLHDFVYRLLDRLFSEPERLRLASVRRAERRNS